MKGRRREREKGRIIGKVDSATFCGPWKSKKSDGDLNRSRVGPSLHGSSIVPSTRYTRFTLWDQGREGEGWRWRIFPRRGVKGGSCPWFGGMRATRNSQKPALFSLFLSLSLLLLLLLIVSFSFQRGIRIGGVSSSFWRKKTGTGGEEGWRATLSTCHPGRGDPREKTNERPLGMKGRTTIVLVRTRKS